MKEGLVRAETLPLVFRALGAESMPRGARVRVRIAGTDRLTLDVHAGVVARLDDATTTADDAVIEEPEAEEGADSAGPLTLAIEVKDEDTEPAAAPAADAA
jgi:exoribonuclease-2